MASSTFTLPNPVRYKFFRIRSPSRVSTTSLFSYFIIFSLSSAILLKHLSISCAFYFHINSSSVYSLNLSSLLKMLLPEPTFDLPGRSPGFMFIFCILLLNCFSFISPYNIIFCLRSSSITSNNYFTCLFSTYNYAFRFYVTGNIAFC